MNYIKSHIGYMQPCRKTPAAAIGATNTNITAAYLLSLSMVSTLLCDVPETKNIAWQLTLVLCSLACL